MDNKAIAGIFYETADLLEIDGQDSFRIRSYRNAAEAIEGLAQQISELISEPKQVLAIPGIGKGMLNNLKEMLGEGRLTLHAELLKKYKPSMLQLLKVQGLGPKTISLIWSAYQVCDLEGAAQLAREGKIRILPRMGQKHEQKLLKAIEDYRRIAGRFLLDTAETQAQKIAEHLRDYPGVDKATPAGSLRRGRETVGDLDILVTGPACSNDTERQKLIEHIITLPGLMEILARGENKVSFRLRGGMQVDVRFLPPESFGAAMQYFTGSKAHNVSLRQRALKMGYTLNEYSLASLENQRALEHVQRIHEAGKAVDGIRIFAGIEVDILADGTLDLSDSVLEQMDLVIASVHSHFNQTAEQMTTRLLKTIGNPNVSIIGHPTGRLLLRRDAYGFDLDAVLETAARHK